MVLNFLWHFLLFVVNWQQSQNKKAAQLLQNGHPSETPTQKGIIANFIHQYSPLKSSTQKSSTNESDSLKHKNQEGIKTVSTLHVKEDHDGIAEFLLGLVLGIFSLGLLAILFAPRSGKETQARVQSFITSIPEELNNPDGKTRSLWDKTLCNIENQVGKVNQAIRAGKLADAKRREDQASDYDYSEFSN
jgi:gas vesicle protein